MSTNMSSIHDKLISKTQRRSLISSTDASTTSLGQKSRLKKMPSKNMGTCSDAEPPTASHGGAVRLAVITSGGDSPGMNSAVRAIVRLAMQKGAIVYRIENGYSGLIAGKIFQCEWDDVAGMQREGGTCLGSARCKKFRTFEGRQKAAFNLLRLGIGAIVVIGGDGSLTGANLLKSEWEQHAEAFKEVTQKEQHSLRVEKARAAAEVAFLAKKAVGSSSHSDSGDGGEDDEAGNASEDSDADEACGSGNLATTTVRRLRAKEPVHRENRSMGSVLAKIQKVEDIDIHVPEHLVIVGLVGTIDNDLPVGDLTIGADSALHRIIHAVDCLRSTAQSHSRTFVVEVMGRNCGYLAVMAALITGSDYVMIPEVGLPKNWREVLPSALQQMRSGRQHFIVIIAEGSREVDGTPVTVEDVRLALEETCEIRKTILGHVQRGGAPSALDRLISVFLGERAVMRALELCKELQSTLVLAGKAVSPPAEVVVWDQGSPRCVPLAQAVSAVRDVEKALEELDFQRALQLRGPCFRNALDKFLALGNIPTANGPYAAHEIAKAKVSKRIGFLHMGGVSPGMNDAFRSTLKWGALRGHSMFGVRNGFDGLCEGQIIELDFHDGDGMCGGAGAFLGTRRAYRQEDFGTAARVVEELQLDGLILAGGWEAYMCALEIDRARSSYRGFKNLTLVCLPASISNNLPATQWTCGSDTALNVVCSSVDLLRMSAAAATRVFVVDVLGSSGYQVVMGGIAGGVECTHIPENPVSLESISNDLNTIKTHFRNGKAKAVMLRSENRNSVFSVPFLRGLFESSSEDLFDVRTVELGHLQNGGIPTPQDRMLGALLGPKAIEAVEQADGVLKLFCVGWNKNEPTITSGPEMQVYMDIEERGVHDPWWLKYYHLTTCLTLYSEREQDTKPSKPLQGSRLKKALGQD